MARRQQLVSLSIHEYHPESIVEWIHEIRNVSRKSLYLFLTVTYSIMCR